MASLLLLLPTGDAPVEEHVLVKEETLLGRHPDCDVVIPYLCCARRHARVLRIGAQFYVEDLGSPGATRLNGPEIGNQIRGRTLLRSGDTIWFATRIGVRFQE
jgi:pSer/pThr/pTyr-binding forkhead associated (FHA) protein